MFEIVESYRESGAVIKVIGIGGGGCNAVNTMIRAELNGVEFIAANTDLQALKRSEAPMKLQVGTNLTKGLGTGANPEIGRNAALEDVGRIRDVLAGSDMVFIAAGLGGGTGTGGAPVIAEVAKEIGALTVAVVTKPFLFEGKRRMRVAEEGLRQLKGMVDTVIAIPNQRLLSIANKTTPLLESFKKADEVLLHASKSISDLITVSGLINLDFADVKTVMSEMGMAFMGVGFSTGEGRAIEAAQRAISSPLLEDISIEGARGLLINVTGGPQLALYEVNEALSLIQKEVHEDANIIFGAVINEQMGEDICITVIATGFGKEEEIRPELKSIHTMPRHLKDDLDFPAFMRKDKAGQEQEVIKLGTMINAYTDGDEYDTPAFLRKQAGTKAAGTKAAGTCR
jgi:cell division protein FtsZ